MTKKNIQCSLAGLWRTTALWAQGRRGFDGIAGSGRRGLREDDGSVDTGRVRVISIMGSGMVWGAQHRGLEEDDIVAGLGTTSLAWGRGPRCPQRHWLGSRKMATRKGLDHGWK
jgi:hypothetical protein